MDVPGLLFQLLFRSVVLLLPLCVAWLAFRRLSLSRTTNAWLYAVTGILAAFTATGLVPWAIGLQQANPIFFLLAAVCPAIWFGVVVLCAPSREADYTLKPGEALAFLHRASPASDGAEDDLSGGDRTPRQADGGPVYDMPLLLQNPQLAEEQTPLFRHQEPPPRAAPAAPLPPAPPGRGVMAIARDMRGHPTSDRRRPKLLAPPAPGSDELPFLRPPRPS